MSHASIVVLKFGGTSVSTRTRWETIMNVAQEHIRQGVRPFIVCSAVSGVSNLLDSLLPAAIHNQHDPILEQIYEKHTVLAKALQVDAHVILKDEFALLSRVALGASLLGEITPRLQAQIMSLGEIMSTKMGAAFLNQIGQKTIWKDARTMLRAIQEENSNDERHFLAAPCIDDPDPKLRQEILEQPTNAITLTQGFIAQDDQGHTVLLGRGGSDTSAAYFASKLSAICLEIWTDVPGMFTADPRQVPSARLLRKLTYFEAQELATTGAKVLHPRCIEPTRRHNIPLHIRCTPSPSMEGTVITSDVADAGAKVKAISAKKNITLISMETVGMWQQVGFLADVFAIFKKNGLSIDLVATSETNVTASLDPVANALDKRRLESLLHDLNEICLAKSIGHCAAISLVGRNIRAILHRLGPVFEAFEEQKVYLMSQASSDLNLTFVVDEEQVDKLIRALHAQLFKDYAPGDQYVGPTWKALFENDLPDHTTQNPWWLDRRDELIALTNKQGATFAYDGPTLDRTIDTLQDIDALQAVFYAIKANNNPQILSRFAQKGMRFECVSITEVNYIFNTFPNIDPKQILFTPNFAPIEEYQEGFNLGVHITLDNMHPLWAHPDVFAKQSFLIRVDPGVGKGHHKHVRTAGHQSKFGILPNDIPKVLEQTTKLGASIIGLHTHVGSGIRAHETWTENAQLLAKIAKTLPDIKILNLGGGLGVPERPGDISLNLNHVASSLNKFKTLNPHFELWMEPGRFCVATAGVLLARVTQIKGKGNHQYIGIETGMNSLIRPSLYGAYHHIVNLSKIDEPIKITADIVGPICESGDVLGHARRLPMTKEGDVILIDTAGAYGRTMSSTYNMRQPALEIVLD